MKIRWRSVCSKDHSSSTCSASAHHGQPTGSLDCLPPATLDGVPHRADVVGGLGLAQLHPLGVAPVQLLIDEVGHIDAVDYEIAEVTGDADIDQPAIPDRDTGQVAVGEPGATQISDVEAGALELLASSAIAGIEPVRSELRLRRVIGRGGSRPRRVARLCHQLQINAVEAGQRSVPCRRDRGRQAAFVSDRRRLRPGCRGARGAQESL